MQPVNQHPSEYIPQSEPVINQDQEGKPKVETWFQRVNHLSQQIANDCNLKKGQRSKFIKHMDQVTKLQQTKSQEMTQNEHLLLAGLYKNLGKLGEHEESLEKALNLLKKVGGSMVAVVRWTLQLTALKSSSKKHQECYELAVKTTADVIQILRQFLPKTLGEEKTLIEFIVELAEEETKDEVVWLYNQRSLEQELLQRLRRSCPGDLYLPFYADIEFHIADIMSLQICRQDWHKKEGGIKELVIYLSIAFFTMATEKYYLKDYSHKSKHIKALKIALSAFDIKCTYVLFLLKILQQHFGQRLESITEEKLVNGEHNQLLRIMPKDTKEISLKNVTFCQD